MATPAYRAAALGVRDGTVIVFALMVMPTMLMAGLRGTSGAVGAIRCGCGFGWVAPCCPCRMAQRPKPEPVVRGGGGSGPARRGGGGTSLEGARRHRPSSARHTCTFWTSWAPTHSPPRSPPREHSRLPCERRQLRAQEHRSSKRVPLGDGDRNDLALLPSGFRAGTRSSVRRRAATSAAARAHRGASAQTHIRSDSRSTPTQKRARAHSAAHWPRGHQAELR